MGISAHEACHHLLHQLRLSNLHFVISETPYSAQIMLRKRFFEGNYWPIYENLFQFYFY